MFSVLTSRFSTLLITWYHVRTYISYYSPIRIDVRVDISTREHEVRKGRALHHSVPFTWYRKLKMTVRHVDSREAYSTTPTTSRTDTAKYTFDENRISRRAHGRNLIRYNIFPDGKSDLLSFRPLVPPPKILFPGCVRVAPLV